MKRKKKKLKNKKKKIESFLDFMKKDIKTLKVRDLMISEDRFTEELIYPQRNRF